MPVCEEEGCDRDAAVELFIPWAENRQVCPGHARTLSRKDGIVPNPMEGREDEWP